MKPAAIPMEEVTRGEDFLASYEVTDLAGDLVNLTLGTIEVYYRARTPAGVLIQKTKGGSTITCTALGVLTVEFSRTETETWVAGTFVDIEIIVEVSSKRIYQARGVLKVVNPSTGDID